MTIAPRVTKGAIVGMDIYNPLASVIIFQYNPHELTRKLQASSTGGAGKKEPYKLTGPPRETITIKVEIDAADQLEKGNPVALTMGIHPQLAALEMLLYPKTLDVIINSALAAAGTIEIVPSDPPMTLFIWGLKRSLPVRIEGFSITEKNHDASLNPLLAEVDLTMQVLSYNDFSITHPGFYMFLTHQVLKETMATIASGNSLANL